MNNLLDQFAQVMAELNCSSLYAIVPYDKYKALQRAAASSSAGALALSRHRVQQRNLSTGITPTMEKCSTAAAAAAFLSPLSPPFSMTMTAPDANGKKNKKRSISPDERIEVGLVAAAAAAADTAGGAGPNVYKRSKSVTEDGASVTTKKPVFEEPDYWG